LKPVPDPRQTILALVRLDNPLKQGLKQRVLALARVDVIVRLDNPLKQGLKHDYTCRVCGKA